MEPVPTVTAMELQQQFETRTKKKRKEKKPIWIENPAFAALESMKEAVHNALTNCEPGDELETLIQTLKHDVPQEVHDDVLASFKSSYPGKFESEQLHLYGSHVTGLAFKDSDLDYYVELPTRDQQKSEKSRNKRIKKIFKRSKFANLKSIIKTRIPIVRCTHIRNPTVCDFNSSNQHGYLNSPIMAHLLQFDSRIHKLAILIKYWMRIHDCSGTDRLSNYAITWMLIFYLQTLPQPIVPPIEEFQRNVPPRMVSHYNFAFDYSIPNKTENRTEWPELLLGFFKFYRDFDYGTQLICPLYGKTFLKTDVQQKTLTEFQRYEEILLTGEVKGMHLRWNNFCIQDPFEITRKVPGVVRWLEKILSKIGYAAEIVERELQQGDRKSLLLQIFDVAKFEQYAHENAQGSEKRKESRKRSYKATQEPISKTSDLSINNECKKMKLQLEPTNFIFQHRAWKNVADNCSVQSDAHLIRKMWAKEVIEMIPDIFRDIFLLDVTGVACDDDESSNNEPSDGFVKVFHVKGEGDLTTGVGCDDDDSSSNESSDGFVKVCPLKGEGDLTTGVGCDDDDSSNNEPSDGFVKIFHLKGARDLFYRRKLKRFTWNEEVFYSSKCFDLTLNPCPLDISVNIAADTVNFHNISIEFTDKIKTRRANYYKAFSIYCTQRLDYYLEIYFAHRNKSSIDTVNEAKIMQLIVQPPVERMKISSPVYLKLLPTEFTLTSLLTNKNYYEEVKESQISNIKQLWAQEVIKMIPDILRDIFKLQIDKCDTNMRSFYLIGWYCKCNHMFSGRKLLKSVNDDTWYNEVQESSKRFETKPLDTYVPLKVYVRIADDVENFEYVSIQLCDQIRTKKNNSFKAFCNEFLTRINYLQKIYFVRRNKVTDSDAMAAKPDDSASTLPNTEIVARQDDSASTLPDTEIVSQDVEMPQDTLEEPTTIMQHCVLM